MGFPRIAEILNVIPKVPKFSSFPVRLGKAYLTPFMTSTAPSHTVKLDTKLSLCNVYSCIVHAIAVLAALNEICLYKVFKVALFDEEEIHEDLHLMIAESPDESQTVVYGEVYVKFTVISDVCRLCLYKTEHVLF